MLKEDFIVKFRVKRILGESFENLGYQKPHYWLTEDPLCNIKQVILAKMIQYSLHRLNMISNFVKYVIYFRGCLLPSHIQTDRFLSLSITSQVVGTEATYMASALEWFHKVTKMSNFWECYSSITNEEGGSYIFGSSSRKVSLGLNRLLIPTSLQWFYIV